MSPWIIDDKSTFLKYMIKKRRKKQNWEGKG